jgi:hypothetical protein
MGGGPALMHAAHAVQAQEQIQEVVIAEAA